MKAHLSLCSALALVALSACSGSKEEDSGSAAPPPPPATTTAPATTTTSLVLTVEGPQPKPGIVARVKAEVDARSDGITGAALSVTGARATLQTPTGWATTKGDVTVVASGDKKAQIGASGFGTEGAEAKLAAAAAALGLTGCEWNPPDRLTIGKNLLAGTAADGRCTRGSAQVAAAYVAPQAEGLVVVGAWEEGGDSASVFGAMRSIVKTAGGGGDGISACCAALRQNANSAPPDQKSALLTAAAVCDSVRSNPQGRAALAQVRAALRGANMPSSCR